jgi:hypothetical protein
MIGSAPVRCLSRLFGGRGWNKRFHGNQVYLQTLANRADILLLQEHWLHTFEKHKLDDFLPDYVCLTKCFDDCIVQDIPDCREIPLY